MIVSIIVPNTSFYMYITHRDSQKAFDFRD